MIRSKAAPGPRRELELKCSPYQTRPCQFLEIHLTDSRMCEISYTRLQRLIILLYLLLFGLREVFIPKLHHIVWINLFCSNNLITYMIILKVTRIHRMKKIQIMRTRRISTFSMNKIVTVGSRSDSSRDSSIIFLSYCLMLSL